MDDATVHIEAVVAHTEDATSHIEAVIVYIEDETMCIAVTTNHEEDETAHTAHDNENAMLNKQTKVSPYL